MKDRLLAVSRILRRLLSLAAVVLLVAIVAAGLAAYVAATGKSLPLLRTITGWAGQIFGEQRTEQMVLDIQVQPEQGRLAGMARLTVRSLVDRHKRFYFLLNSGVRLRTVRAAEVDTSVGPVTTYQLGMLTVVDLPTPVAKNAAVELTFEYEGQPTAALGGVAASFIKADEVQLNVDALWYPTDAQSFFNAYVTVTLPAALTVVHNGAHAFRSDRGGLQQVYWTSERPVPGLSLVAGHYSARSAEVDDIAYRLFLPSDVQLDSAHILKLMADANGTLTERYGASGFKSVTVFVSRNLRRGYNDGSGLIGLSIRYLRAGDYGFGLIAHEIAHDWWGSTVAEKWLTPGTGGEWIVEGFAEFSSLVAAEAEYGPDALTRRLAGEFFDPARQAAIAEMSVLDNALAEATARDTIYRKGAYVAMMLRRILGDEVYFRGLRQFLERFQYQQASEQDLQQVLEETSGQKLDDYFSDWVRSNKLADLSLDSGNTPELTVNNLGAARIGGDIDLWTFKKGEPQATRSTVHVGDHVPLPPDTELAVLDPQLAWADVQRENNRYPRRSDPVWVATTARGQVAVTRGAPFPWVRASVTSMDGAGHVQHTWEFNRGMAAAPTWAPDGSRLLVSYAEADQPVPAIVSLAADGPQRTIGNGAAPAVASDGSVYAAQQDRIVKINSGTSVGAVDGNSSTVVQRPGEILDLPVPSPDGTRIVYTAARGNHLELRVVSRDGRDDRLITTWDRDWMTYVWSHDGTHLYAVVGGNWDWAVWEVPVGAGAIHVLAHDAALIVALGLSPDGRRIAFTAAPALDYPRNRRQLFILNLAGREVRTVDVPDADLTDLTWVDDDAILVVATAVSDEQPFIVPPRRSLKRVKPSDGSVEEIP